MSTSYRIKRIKKARKQAITEVLIAAPFLLLFAIFLLNINLK